MVTYELSTHPIDNTQSNCVAPPGFCKPIVDIPADFCSLLHTFTIFDLQLDFHVVSTL